VFANRALALSDISVLMLILTYGSLGAFIPPRSNNVLNNYVRILSDVFSSLTISIARSTKYGVAILILSLANYTLLSICSLTNWFSK